MPYSRDLTKANVLHNYKLEQLDRCDSSMDLIVLPEYSDVPCATADWEQTLDLHNRFSGEILEKCAATARRCSAMVFVNGLSLEPEGWRNTTYIFDRKGILVGKYYKRHLPPLEAEVLKLDGEYTLEPLEPFVLELDGVRYGFLTCYDFYFYEAFSNIARQNVDVIIGCSLQRSDTHAAIETMCRFLAYNTNAWVLRSSVSFSEDSTICGASMIVSPEGKVISNMGGSFGMAIAEIDPNAKYYKSAGYGNPNASHHAYIEYGRRPWQYRTAGPSTVPFDTLMPYPRVCAHRGFSAAVPENTMPSFGAAVALGTQEIELEIWSTKDGVLVSCHSEALEQVSDGTGRIGDYTYDELLKLDFGTKFGVSFQGLQIPTFEEILRKFSNQVIMNIHVKIWDRAQPEDHMEQIVRLVRRYDCVRHVYFMTTNDAMIQKVRAYAPDIPCCVGWDGTKDTAAMVDRAIRLGAKKIQLCKTWINRETIERAHSHGIVCIAFVTDDPKEARRYLDMGIDTLLTNDCILMLRMTKQWKHERESRIQE